MRSNDEIIDLLTRLKDEQNLSISEIARRVGMAKSAVSRYYNKSREFPLNRAAEFAKVFGVSTEYLLGLDVNDNQTDNDNIKVKSSIDLANRITNLRYSKDWSQVELGRRIGLDKSTMNKIENGTRKVQTDELKLLSEVFDVSVDYLLNGSNNFNKPLDNEINNPKIQTIAAHIDDDVTEEQMDDILNYIEFIKQKHRKKR